ncbi:energy transducer TonB [Sphingobium sp. AP49]|uniref:energy transducer TonB n=1 Tax=Sphingobium sp. AP49 TaxID=1144307 RepID=UPI00026EDF74|nr:energy transducer TonB [Sphingobium sp. AP49]WHO41225.1 energy transducer TonB [Sphingobium sp. AP49]
MLQAAQGRADAFATEPVEIGADRPAAAQPVFHARPMESPTERYGMRKRPNMPVVLGILAVHALLIGALIQVRNHVARAEEAKLTVVNLSPPPPPPAAEAPPPPPSQPQIVAPPPIVQTPAPPVQIMTTPDPAPAPSPAVTSSVPAPSAPAAPTVSVAAPSVLQAGDIGAQMVAGKPPRYPIDSRREREQGTVVLALVVGIDGAVESIGISRSSGFTRLDDAARDAVKHWRWRPIVRDGQAVRVKGVVEIPFVLRSESA